MILRTTHLILGMCRARADVSVQTSLADVMTRRAGQSNSEIVLGQQVDEQTPISIRVYSGCLLCEDRDCYAAFSRDRNGNPKP